MFKHFGKMVDAKTKKLALIALSLGGLAGLGVAGFFAAEATAASARPPAPTITIHPDSLTSSTDATFGFTDGTGSVTFVCSLDRAPYSACESPQPYSALSLGKHTFAVEAVAASTGKGGAKTSSATKFSWTINLPAPTITTRPTTPTASTTATFAFSSDVSGVGFECSLDGARYRTCASPVTYTGLAVGTHRFAVEATEKSAPTSTPATVTWTISRLTLPTSTSLETVGTMSYGYETIHGFSGTVTGVPGSGYPTGTVTVTTGSTTLCSTTLETGSGDTARFSCATTTSTLLAAGSYTVHAHFPGGTSSTPGVTYSASTSSSQTLTVDPVAPTFLVTVTGTSAASITVGSTATLGEEGIPGTSGTVAFKTANGTTLCTATLPTATCSTSTTLAGGNYTITGYFTPKPSTANLLASTSYNSVTLTVGRTLEMTIFYAITPTSASVPWGSETQFRFRGTAIGVYGDGAPTGTIEVNTATGATICTTTLLATSRSDTSVFYCYVDTATVLPAGTYTVRIHYTGGPSVDPLYSYLPTTSSPRTITVEPLSPTFTITVTGTTYTVFTTAGSPVTFAESGITLSAGSVAFETANGTVLCTATLPTTSCTTSTIPPGVYSVTGYFTPTPATVNYGPSTSNTVTLTVRSVESTTTTLTVSQPTVTYGTETAVTFSGTVVGVAGAGHPQGSVTVWTATGNLVCTSGLTAAYTTGTDVSTFSCQVYTGGYLPARSTPYSLAAIYSPTSSSSSTTRFSYTGSTSTPVLLTVTVATETTTTTLGLSTLEVTYGAETTITLSGTVTGLTGYGTPQGTVEVTDAVVTTICTATLEPTSSSSASFSCSTTTGKLLAATTSPYAVTATFEPTATSSSSTPSVVYSTSTSTPQYLTVDIAYEQASFTSFGISTPSVTYGSETVVTFSGQLTGVTGAGYPEGTVSIWTTGGDFVCTATLSTGTGATASFSCSIPSPTALSPGTYSLYAEYLTGPSSTPSSVYVGADSTPVQLTVIATS